MLGLAVALIAVLRVWFFTDASQLQGNISVELLMFCIGLAVCIQVATATLIGLLLPLSAEKLGFDPALVATPAITTLVDITGLLIYFSLAVSMLNITL